ncbi:Beta-galactosidase [Streptococcus sp. DD11]|uniref:sugar-binding domain-containing protein n=1 Tax=Streptococcus sp. DD11 TaxID=1777879 RepID=UPI0007970B75|nr:sugar-binding domain-containing protein [Streptococcus sp. DD11]KXT83397.1 Beta-galactosidase [Streptococcus sp. DD11]
MKELRGQQTLRKHWLFSQQVTKDQALAEEICPEDWESVKLPHDWSIYYDFDAQSPAQNEGGQLNGGSAWYRTAFFLEDDVSKKAVRLCFDGVYMDSQVFVNGQLVGRYPSGYTPFSYDITRYLRNDGSENILAVHVVNQQPSSRWYSGSGIYRDVHLLVQEQVHVCLDGVAIAFPELEMEQDGWVDTVVETRVTNASLQDAPVYLRQQIIDRQGQVAADWTDSSTQLLLPQMDIVFRQDLPVFQPALWDVRSEEPALYQLITRVYQGNTLVDERSDSFGYRYLSWSPSQGFFLNGQYLKLHGVCLHHDHGALGAAENEKAEYRRLKQMKEMGANAIRTAHNPASPQTLKLAAELGLLVQEEAFDTWYGGKKTYDYGRFFEEKALHPEAKAGDTWSDYDLRMLVERGKNNPAIFMWSIGNEISEAKGDAHSLATVKRLVQVVKSVDPTRYVTMGIDAFRFGDGSGGHERIAAELDAVGLNYAEENVNQLRRRHPDWLLYGSETSSATRTRGSYFRPHREWIGHNKGLRNFEQSDYGNDRVAWGRTASSAWLFDRDRADYAGQFVWTGCDYIGEPTPWHNQNETPVNSSYFGLVDTAGIPKNDYYFYQSQWRTQDDCPMVHLLPHWNWEKAGLRRQVMDSSGRIPVRVYSNAASVELYLNGLSQGRKAFCQKKTVDGRPYQEGSRAAELYLEWLLPYVPGELLAVAYNQVGEEIARDCLQTAGKAARLHLLREEDRIRADGREVAYIRYQIEDSDGNLVPTANHQVHFSLSGQGRMVGLDNGRQASRERYKAQADGTWRRRAFNGQGMAIIESTEEDGSFTLHASSQGLEADSVTIFTGEGTAVCQQPAESLELSFGSDEWLEDETLQLECFVCYPDGRKQRISAQALEWEISGEGWLTIKEDRCQLRQAGKVTLRASYGHLQTELQRMIQSRRKLTRAVAVRPIRVYTQLQQQPVLPEKVVVEMEGGFPKTYPVSWETVSEENLSRYQEVTVTGRVSGLSLTAAALVVVEGIVAVENGSAVTLVNEAPDLPERVSVFLSNGKTDTAAVDWEKISPQQYAQPGSFLLKGSVSGCRLQAELQVRVAERGQLSEIISDQWTGSPLPLAFASGSQKQHGAAYLNDRQLAVSGKSSRYWTSAAGADQAYAGVLFGDAGMLSERFADNLFLHFHQMSPCSLLENIRVEYYVGKEPQLPQDADNLAKEETALSDSQHWKSVAHLSIAEPPAAGSILALHFDKVQTYALRVLFSGLTQAPALAELQVFARKAPAFATADARIFIKGQELQLREDQQDIVLGETVLPSQIKLKLTQGASSTVIPAVKADEPIRLLIRAENGSLLQEYRLWQTEVRPKS